MATYVVFFLDFVFFLGGGGELLYFLKMKYKEHINIYPLLSLESFVECSDY